MANFIISLGEAVKLVWHFEDANKVFPFLLDHGIRTVLKRKLKNTYPFKLLGQEQKEEILTEVRQLLDSVHPEAKGNLLSLIATAHEQIELLKTDYRQTPPEQYWRIDGRIKKIGFPKVDLLELLNESALTFGYGDMPLEEQKQRIISILDDKYLKIDN